jgi:hypothetical protein
MELGLRPDEVRDHGTAMDGRGVRAGAVEGVVVVERRTARFDLDRDEPELLAFG